MGGRDYSAALAVTLRDGTKLQFHAFAYYIDVMKRNEKGHPMKSESTGQKPTFKLAIGDPIWSAIASADGETAMVAHGREPRRIEVPALAGIEKAPQKIGA